MQRYLLDALKARFGAALAVYKSDYGADLVATPDAERMRRATHTKGGGNEAESPSPTRLIDAAKTFGAATAVVGPHGFGLANILYCEVSVRMRVRVA